MRHTARACSFARSVVRARVRSTREKDGAEERRAGANVIMRVYVSKWYPIMLTRGELRGEFRDGLPRILVEIMIDSRYSPICRLINSKMRKRLCKSLCRLGNYLINRIRFYVYDSLKFS